jgi:Virulence factor BrkB
MRRATSSVTRRTISLPLLAIAAVAAVTLRSKLRILDAKLQPQRGRRVPISASAKSAARAGSDGPTHGWVPPWPWQISLRHWRAILARTYSEINEDRMMAVAGGVVFFILLAIFPGITAFVSLYALFADPATISNHLAAAADMVPTDAFNLLRGEVERVASKGPGTLGLASIFGLLFAFWSANSGMKAIFDALNVANDETEKRGFFKLNFVSFAFTLGTIAFMLLAVGAVVLVPLLFWPDRSPGLSRGSNFSVEMAGSFHPSGSGAFPSLRLWTQQAHRTLELVDDRELGSDLPVGLGGSYIFLVPRARCRL